MLYERGKPVQGQKVFIAVAAYEGLGAGFSYSLFHTGAALARAGVGSELAIYSGNCHVDDSRNRLAHDFLLSDCTDLVFLDADIGWSAESFLKLIAYDRDVVAGVYPKKNGDDAFPVKTLPGEIWSDREGLIEVAGVPTGFLRIRRAVIERLAERAVRYNAKNDSAYGTALIFEREIHAGTRWGGDYVFCRKWRELGGKIYIDPMMRFEHSGEDTWSGCVGTWLRQRSGIGLKAGLAAVSQGKETIEHFIQLHDAWGNKFAASTVMLAALAVLARESVRPILECGSGLSTLIMAAANPSIEIHVLENSPIFAEHLRIEAGKHGLTNIHIHSRPLKDGWYDCETLPALEWALVVIDGPPRKDANRLEILSRLDLSAATVVADDVQAHGGVVGMIDALTKTHHVRLSGEANETRVFAICAPKSKVEAEAA